MDDLRQQFEDGKLDDQYATYIMSNCGGERIINNGNALLIAMEEGYLAESFLDFIGA